ncbi:hypothetical protein [Brevibacillus formosus]|uniref:hypothetical protein n=1 Tax=Brevibacillus formosus TaxID=54913 RepID=UPI000B5A8C97|nr:hypothetical protein [Brevibacillus formosus]UKK99401.1 hypothetical protein FO446_19070 [Brevibacillus brevis]
MELHIRTDASVALTLKREIICHGISRFYVRPYDDDHVEFIFLALSEHQKKLLSYSLRNYSYCLTYLA